MVAVNQITTLPTAAAQMVFVQEVYCRAYALHVLVSSMAGWKLTASDGSLLEHGRAEHATALLDNLFPAKKAKGSSPDATRVHH